MLNSLLVELNRQEVCKMKDFLIGKPMRLFLFVIGLVMWLGIYLTGFATVHWLLYLPAVFFIFAAVTGICPGMWFSNMLVKDHQEPST